MANFDIGQFGRELQQLERGGFRQVRHVSLDGTNAVTKKEYCMEGNGLLLIPTWLTDQGSGLVEVTSDLNLRVWVHLNERDADPIPLSFVANAGDQVLIAATFRRFFLTT